MNINTSAKPLTFLEDDHELRVEYANRGEPFREGVQVSLRFERDREWSYTAVLLDRYEVQQLRDKLTEFLKEATK